MPASTRNANHSKRKHSRAVKAWTDTVTAAKKTPPWPASKTSKDTKRRSTPSQEWTQGKTTRMARVRMMDNERWGGKEKLHTRVVGTESGAAALESSLQFLKRLKGISTWPSDSARKHTPKRNLIHPHENLCTRSQQRCSSPPKAGNSPSVHQQMNKHNLPPHTERPRPPAGAPTCCPGTDPKPTMRREGARHRRARRV